MLKPGQSHSPYPPSVPAPTLAPASASTTAAAAPPASQAQRAPRAPRAPLDRNKIAAKLLKSRMRNDTAAIAKYESMLNPNTILEVDANGARLNPVKASTKGDRNNRRGTKAKLETHDPSSGLRSRFLRQDEIGEELTARQMLIQEREAGKTTRRGLDSMDQAYIDNIVAAGKNYNGSLAGDDEDDEYGTGQAWNMWESRKLGQSSAKQEAKARAAAIRATQKHDAALAKCSLCFGAPSMRKARVIATGEHVYLAAPASRLLDGHLIIAPREHVLSFRDSPDDTYAEAMTVMASLIAFYSASGQDVVFSETVVRNHDRLTHTHIDVIPLDRESGAMAPVYFRKALEESDTMWASHAKLIDASSKGLRRSVPEGFPYVFVQFGSSPAYAHAIEDASLFHPAYALEIVAGILDIPHTKWRNPKPEPPQAQSAAIDAFSHAFEPFDWTRHS